MRTLFSRCEASMLASPWAMKLLCAGSALALAACQPSVASSTTPRVVAGSTHEAGAYVAELGGCHDCHTPGWAQTGGQVPAQALLVGSDVGFRGPWGTSYPGNLRVVAASMTADEWADMLRSRQGLPPMPWSTLNHMNRADLKALHAYIVSLGAPGSAAPLALAPDVEPQTAVINFVPVMPAAR